MADVPPSDSVEHRLRDAAVHVQSGDLDGYVLVLPDLLTDAAAEIEQLRTTVRFLREPR